MTPASDKSDASAGTHTWSVGDGFNTVREFSDPNEMAEFLRNPGTRRTLWVNDSPTRNSLFDIRWSTWLAVYDSLNPAPSPAPVLAPAAVELSRWIVHHQLSPDGHGRLFCIGCNSIAIYNGDDMEIRYH